MRPAPLKKKKKSFLTVLPSDLKGVLKTVTKYTDNVGGGTGSVELNVTATTDTLFLMNVHELRGVGTCNIYERNKTAQYAYYANGNEKKRGKYNDASTIIRFWLRSVNPSDERFTALNENGGGHLTGANVNYGVSPCFCV